MDSLLIRSLPRALCVCYWLRTCKCPLLTSWGRGWQILPGAELCTLKLMLCSSRPDPRSHSLLSKGLPGAAAIPRHQTQGRSLSSLRGATLAVPPPAVGHGWEQLSQGEGRQVLPSTTVLEGRLVPLKCEGLRRMPLSRIWAPSL